MKIYVPEQPKITRLMITKQGSDTKYINLVGTDREEVLGVIEKLVTKYAREKGFTPIVKGRKTSVVVREYVDKNGPSKSISFYGLEPIEVQELMLNYLKELGL